jgi:cell wall assembly regulator SMI1
MELVGVDAFQRIWERFEGWLVTHAPNDHAALRPPAGAGAITGLESRLGFSLHPELRALLELHDGVPDPGTGGGPGRFRAGAFLPFGYHLIGVDGVTSRYDGIVADLAEEAEEDSAECPAAYRGFLDGDALREHIRRWVPFASGGDGDIVFVDHRLGASYGHVYAFGVATGGWPPVRWADNLTDLFDHLAGALETGESFQGLRPGIHESRSGRRGVRWEARARRSR